RIRGALVRDPGSSLPGDAGAGATCPHSIARSSGSFRGPVSRTAKRGRLDSPTSTGGRAMKRVVVGSVIAVAFGVLGFVARGAASDEPPKGPAKSPQE